MERGLSMALIKKKMTQYGFEAEYWKISRISIDTIKEEVCFTLNLYLNKENQTRELEDYTFGSLLLDPLEFKPLYNKYFRKDKGSEYKDIYTACYMFAKDNIDFFNDAADDPEEVYYNTLRYAKG